MNSAPILNSIFNNTTNSYKFYWWLSILDIIKNKNKLVLSFDEIVFQIIIKIWYPVNYFKLSFGKQDQLAKYVFQIKNKYGLRDDISEKDLLKLLILHKDDILIKNISEKITKYVPFRFLRPWFGVELRSQKDAIINSKILKLQDSNKLIPYKINVQNKEIIINESWFYWMKSNHVIIESFTYYQLSRYFEKNNPNISSLIIKLFKPQSRRLYTAKKLWSGFISAHSGVLDVFEKKPLNSLNILSVDHFIPWSFVTHDQLWNLHPIEKSVNSSKSNFIPSDSYLEDYGELQYEFSRYLIDVKQNKSLEDYYTIYNVGADKFRVLKRSDFIIKMRDLFFPKFEIARNMGYESDWFIK